MVPDGARTSARFAAATSPFHGDGHGRVTRDGAMASFRDDEYDRRGPTRASSRRGAPGPPPPPSLPPPPRRLTRSPTGSGSAPSTSAAMFLGRDYFHCPELDQRMKKYLVRLANETANHLIRDTLEPDNANLQWRPMATVKGIEILRGFEQPHHVAQDPGAALKDATCLRGVAQVSASIEEFAMLFKLDTNRQLAEHGLLFNPDLLDMATLYSLVQPSGDHPRRYVGIKWCLVQSPSRLFRNRDFCYLECQKEFRDARGRRGWVRSMHSIKMPCCPTLEKSHGVVRASLYRCGLIAVETDKPGVLDTTYTIEMDLKGHFPEIFQPKFLSQRIAALASIDKYLQQQRLSSSPLLGDLDIPKTKVKGTCHFCFREFSTFTKRHICRKCGECVCKNCSDDWQLDVPVIGSMKVRICTVCSAEARSCHVTPRQTVVFDRAGYEEDPVKDQSYYKYNPGPRVRRSNSMPENHEYGESPFQRTAQEPARSVFHSTGSMASDANHQIEPSEYFAAEHKRYQQQQYLAARQSQAHYRESDFTSEIHDFTNGEIRATADLTNLWTKQDADRYSTRNGTFQEPRGRRPSHPPQKNRTRSVDMQENYTGRARAPTEESERSVYRDNAPASANYGHDGHFPPSARYTVVGDRLERANSFDAGRQLEEQQHRQQQKQRWQQSEYQQPQLPHYGNSRRSQRPLNGSYSPHNGYLPSSPSPTSISQYQGQHSQSPSQSSRQNLQYRQPSKQSDNRHAPRQQQTPPAAPAPRNIALEFARQPHAPSSSTSSTPRNIALDFARQPQASQPHSAPRNVALEFLKQTQSSASTPAPRNVALEFLNNLGGGAKVPWSQMVDDEPEPHSSLEMTGGPEPVEYVETPSGEWIASDKWEKGVLTKSYMDFEDGEPLETRECDTCGAKQYVHEGVVEPTCDCDIDDELTRPSTQSGQSSRDESRVSFRVEGNVFDSNESFIDPVHSNNESFGGGKIMVPVDVDDIVPLLVERLSQHSLRSSFHHT